MSPKQTPKPGIYFINRHADGDVTMIKTHIDSSWPDLLEQFKRFLLASGYILPYDGEFEFVPAEKEVRNESE